MDFIISRGLIGLWTHGDDSLLLDATGPELLFGEMDLSQCDRLHRQDAFELHRKHTLKWLSTFLPSVGPQGCRYFNGLELKFELVKASRQFGPFRIILRTIEGDYDSQQATGSTGTSIMNTDFVAIPFLVAHLDGKTPQVLDGTHPFWEFGQKVKRRTFILSRDFSDWQDVPTFLKGFWAPDTQGRWTWVRLPSFVLKLFKSRKFYAHIPGLKRYRSEHLSDFEAAERFLAMSCKGWAAFTHMPIIQEFLDGWASRWGVALLPDSRVEVDQQERRTLTADVWGPVARRYGLSELALIDWAHQLSALKVGAVSNHVAWFALGYDYA